MPKSQVYTSAERPPHSHHPNQMLRTLHALRLAALHMQHNMLSNHGTMASDARSSCINLKPKHCSCPLTQLLPNSRHSGLTSKLCFSGNRQEHRYCSSVSSVSTGQPPIRCTNGQPQVLRSAQPRLKLLHGAHVAVKPHSFPPAQPNTNPQGQVEQGHHKANAKHGTHGVVPDAGATSRHRGWRE